MAKLSGTTVMLTGAGGALATAIAQELIDAGAELLLVGRGEALARAEDRLPAKKVFDLDLTDPACVDKLRKQKADVLIHTAGAFSAQDAQKAEDEDYQRLFGANMLTLFHAVQGVLPHMLKQKEGMILGVSAGQAAHMSGPGAAPLHRQQGGGGGVSAQPQRRTQKQGRQYPDPLPDGCD